MEDVGTFYVETFGLFFGHLIHFMDIWYILWSLGM
jgi:hypothetical protein